jgi:hypothetical protein
VCASVDVGGVYLVVLRYISSHVVLFISVSCVTTPIDALKIFENCPAADKMKDVSLMFPIYNMVGIQLKGGVIDQDDECSLEMELAIRFCHEAQLQAYHYARSLANLAEMYGRVGVLDEALKYFNIMKAVYMKQDHPKLLLDAYGKCRH